MNYKISIIIPIYNCEKQIKFTVNSILKQTYKNIELVLVDDGSTDNSLKICESYKDQRIKIFHQKNKGVSSARNLGLKNISGDYVMFIDGDDIIKSNCIEECIKYLHKYKTDIVKFNFTREIGFLRKHNTFKLPSNTMISKINYNQVYKHLFDANILRTCCTCLIKKEIAKKIKFKTNYGMAEDSLYFYQCLKNSQSIYLIDNELYIYNYNCKSITHQFDIIKNIKLLEDVINVYQFIEKDVNANSKVNISSKKVIENAIKNSLEKCFENTNFIEYKKYITAIFNNKNILTKIKSNLELNNLIKLNKKQFEKLSKKYKIKNLIKYILS